MNRTAAPPPAGRESKAKKANKLGLLAEEGHGEPTERTLDRNS